MDIMEEVVFKTLVGTIIGTKENAVVRILGIPYAKAERYQYPKPIPAFTEPFFAKKYAPAPPQNASPVLEKVLGVDILKSLTMDENCQNLSITIPENTTINARLPVMVWIYGGSYSSGAGDAEVYNPTLLAREQNLIVVNINYRLGILGFLGGFDGRPANLGLMDIIAAIRWIKNNIAAFGGNPNNITLFGQSAGGDAIAHLIMTEDAKDLFQNVIIQSAPLGIRKKRKKMTQTMIEMTKALQPNAPLEVILKKQEEINLAMRKFGLKGGMPFGVQYGFATLPQEENTITAWQGNAKHFNILIGFTDEETSLFMPFVPIVQKLKKLPVFGKSIAKMIIRKTTDIIYRKPAIALAKDMAIHSANVYLYNISWGAKNGFGATHTIDIPLLFGDETVWKSAQLLDGISWSKQYEDGKKLRNIWGQFARNGQLGEKDIPNLISIKKIEK